jgi:hypothetical protein
MDIIEKALAIMLLGDIHLRQTTSGSCVRCCDDVTIRGRQGNLKSVRLTAEVEHDGDWYRCDHLGRGVGIDAKL